jgi:hypothetical protein
VLADRQWDKLFSTATAGAVLFEALEVTREHIETLIPADQPGEQFLARALSAMAGSLSTKLAGGGSIQDLLSRRQVVDLTRVVFLEVARSPELLVGDTASDPKKTVLAQVIASVAKALGDEPTLLTDGAGVIELTQVALRATLRNADRLIDTEKLTPGSNVLFQILKQIVATVAESEDPRKLVTREVFQEIVERTLPVVSANLEALEDQPKVVARAIGAGLELARGALAGRINGDNLAPLIGQLLHRAVWNELKLDDAPQLKEAALTILHAA